MKGREIDLIGIIQRRVEQAVGRLMHVVRRVQVSSVWSDWKVQALGFGATSTEAGDEQWDKAEFFQHGGFASRPKNGDQAILVCVGGRAGHPVVIATRGPRPDLNEGDAALFNYALNALVKALDDGNIEIQVDGTKTVKVRTGGAAPTVKVALKPDVELHTHPGTGALIAPPFGGPVSGMTGPANLGTYTIKGAKVLEAESA